MKNRSHKLVCDIETGRSKSQNFLLCRGWGGGGGGKIPNTREVYEKNDFTQGEY